MSITLKKDQIYRQIREKIVSGSYKPSEKLPRATVLSETMGVSMKTMRTALGQLEKDGFIQRVHGLGTFVNAETPDSHPKYLLLDSTTGIESSNNVIIPLLEKCAEKENIILEKCVYEFFREQPFDDSLNYIEKSGFSGIINTASGYTGNEEILELFRKCNLPVVLSHASFSDRKLNGIAIIHPQIDVAFTDGIRFLADKGHRRIAVIGEVTTSGIRHIDNNRFNALLKELKCEINPEYFIQCSYDANTILTKIEHLMSLSARPTAIQCFSDFYAIYVYNALKTLGYRIPDDIAVLGYCNYPGGQTMEPPLSTIDLGHEEAARLTLDLLKKSHQWFNCKNVATPEVIVKHHIIERGSSVIKRIEHELVSA